MNLSLGFLGDVDLTDWVRGLLGGFITGGAGAVTSAFSAAAIAGSTAKWMASRPSPSPMMEPSVCRASVETVCFV